MLYLLDTNIISDVIRNPQGRVTDRIRKLGEEQIATSIIVAAKLRYGAARKASPRLTARVEAILASIEVFPFESPADQEYATLRSRLEEKGKVIGSNDLLIAAHALSLGATLVTANEREFAMVKTLICENWLR